MTELYDDNDIFALVKDGEIVEYPVHYMSIVNRAHPIDMYTKVSFENKPVIPPYHYCPEKVVLTEDGGVVVQYGAVQAIDLDSLLQSAKGPLLMRSMNPPVPQSLSDRIFELAETNVEKMLDEFAQQKGYKKGIDSAVSFIGSTTPEFNDDGVFCRDLRDNVWTAFYLYVNSILAGKAQYPESWLEFASHLPQMIWPKIDYAPITEETILPTEEPPEDTIV